MKNYRMPRKYSKPRKYGGKCEKCGIPTPIEKTFCRVDESNVAITWNAPYLCEKCCKEVPREIT